MRARLIPLLVIALAAAPLLASAVGGVPGAAASSGAAATARVVGSAGDPRAVVLAAHQQILVAFGTARQLPARIPTTHVFEPGA